MVVPSGEKCAPVSEISSVLVRFTASPPALGIAKCQSIPGRHDPARSVSTYRLVTRQHRLGDHRTGRRLTTTVRRHCAYRKASKSSSTGIGLATGLEGVSIDFGSVNWRSSGLDDSASITAANKIIAARPALTSASAKKLRICKEHTPGNAST
jgi:hypothetical protein